MKKYIYLILFCLLFSFSCTEDDGPATACGFTDPIEDLAWLQQMADDLSVGSLSEYSYIKQATYKGQTVFFSGSCCPTCNWALILYDCSGNAIQGEDYTMDDLEDQRLIWQPEDFTCNFN